jgi:hypothetical protein
VTVAGGWYPGEYLDIIIRMNAEPKPDLSIPWSDCPVKLPAKLRYHSSLVYNDQLLVAGGYDGNLGSTSNCIHKVQLVIYDCNLLYITCLYMIAGTEDARAKLRIVIAHLANVAAMHAKTDQRFVLQIRNLEYV